MLAWIYNNNVAQGALAVKFRGTIWYLVRNFCFSSALPSISLSLYFIPSVIPASFPSSVSSFIHSFVRLFFTHSIHPFIYFPSFFFFHSFTIFPSKCYFSANSTVSILEVVKNSPSPVTWPVAITSPRMCLMNTTRKYYSATVANKI